MVDLALHDDPDWRIYGCQDNKSRDKCHQWRIQDFPGSVNPKRGGGGAPNLLFAANCMKMKKFGRRDAFKMLLCRSNTCLRCFESRLPD